MRTLGRMTLLVALWLLAWGDLRLANILSGIVVAGALLLAFPPPTRPSEHLTVRPAGALRLIVHVLGQLVTSNVVMARQILRRHPDVHQGVIAHHLRHASEVVVTIMTSIVALSPGTMTVDVDAESTTIYVHFFRLHDVSAARGQLDRLERLIVGAIRTGPPVPPVTTTEEHA
jgi:multicomponent Na+:H+ antiporter subunit E